MKNKGKKMGRGEACTIKESRVGCIRRSIRK